MAFSKKLAEETKDSGLHIALLNAGLANPKYELSEYGYEMVTQVNVISSALMAALIVPLLRKTARKGGNDKPHLTFVNSSAHVEPQRDWYAKEGSLFALANSPDGYSDLRKHYGVTKLLGMSTMLHLAKTVSATSASPSDPDVIINACCPYLCKTNLGRNFALPLRVIGNVMQYFTAKTAEEGSRTLVGATVLGKESHGKYWTMDVLSPLGELARDDKEMEKCWEDVKSVLDSKAPGWEKLAERIESI